MREKDKVKLRNEAQAWRDAKITEMFEKGLENLDEMEKLMLKNWEK